MCHSRIGRHFVKLLEIGRIYSSLQPRRTNSFIMSSQIVKSLQFLNGKSEPTENKARNNVTSFTQNTLWTQCIQSTSFHESPCNTDKEVVNSQGSEPLVKKESRTQRRRRKRKLNLKMIKRLTDSITTKDTVRSCDKSEPTDNEFKVTKLKSFLDSILNRSDKRQVEKKSSYLNFERPDDVVGMVQDTNSPAGESNTSSNSAASEGNLNKLTRRQRKRQREKINLTARLKRLIGASKKFHQNHTSTDTSQTSPQESSDHSSCEIVPSPERPSCNASRRRIKRTTPMESPDISNDNSGNRKFEFVPIEYPGSISTLGCNKPTDNTQPETTVEECRTGLKRKHDVDVDDDDVVIVSASGPSCSSKPPVATELIEIIDDDDEPSQPDNSKKQTVIDSSRYVSLDCEFVGVGPKRLNGLGRCSIVDYYGNTMYDMYVKPDEPITDYRTPWSGIRRKDMYRAIPYECARQQVKKIIKDKILIGHALINDLKVLKIHHPAEDIRDTSRFRPLLRRFDPTQSCVSLKRLTSALLGRTIQKGEHCSVVDARAAMELFRLVEDEWILEPPKKRSRTCSEHDEVNYLDDAYWPK